MTEIESEEWGREGGRQREREGEKLPSTHSIPKRLQQWGLSQIQTRRFPAIYAAEILREISSNHLLCQLSLTLAMCFLACCQRSQSRRVVYDPAYPHLSFKVCMTLLCRQHSCVKTQYCDSGIQELEKVFRDLHVCFSCFKQKAAMSSKECSLQRTLLQYWWCWM